MKKTLQNIIFAAFLIVGVVCSLVMLTARVCAEERCASAAFAIELKSVQRLAAADGRSAEDWLSDLSAAGVGYLIGTDETEAEAKALCARFGMAFARSGNPNHSGIPAWHPVTPQEPQCFIFSRKPSCRVDHDAELIRLAAAHATTCRGFAPPQPNHP